MARIQELHKKVIHDPDNHNGVITHLEPDVLEHEVKWPLGSITMNKASVGDGIPVELFQILKDDAVKVLHSIRRQIWKTQVGSQKNQENSRKTSTSASMTTPKPLTAWITTNCEKFFKRWEYQTTLSAS